MELRTRLNGLLGVRIPLLNAPMTPHAGGRLAKAVSDAGAFGMLGIDESDTVEQIEADGQFLTARANFGVGLVCWMLEKNPVLLEAAIALKPKLISVSFGDPVPYVKRIRDAGILVASQVQTRKSAQQAIDAGVDLLVAQGSEAGGHTGTIGTLPLLQLVLEMTALPVLAAGGIFNGRGFAAALAAGASGVWVGTPFMLSEESRTSPAARARLIESDETQTIYTSVFDVIQNKAWPAQFRGRALKNKFTAQWHGWEKEMLLNPAARTEFAEAKRCDDFTVANLYAGQSVGAIHRTCSARDIVSSFESECAQCILELRDVLS